MTTAPNGELRRQDFHLQVQQLVSLRSLLLGQFAGPDGSSRQRTPIAVTDPVRCRDGKNNKAKKENVHVPIACPVDRGAQPDGRHARRSR